MSKQVTLVAKGIILDNVIDDMIKELAIAISDSETLWKDYLHYRPCILNCAKLYTYISFKFMTKESVMKNWFEYKNQQDDRAIDGFIDYCIMLFTNDPEMQKATEIEQKYINQKLKDRIQKLNRSIQWATK